MSAFDKTSANLVPMVVEQPTAVSVLTIFSRVSLKKGLFS